MIVGFVQHFGLGDNLSIFKSLYLCKSIYHCKLIVFGNACMKSLCAQINFVDECLDIGSLSPNHIDLISSYHFDYLILGNPTRKYFHILKATNAKTILASTKVSNLFSMRCKSVPTHLLPKYRKQSYEENFCALCRKINPKLYDASIKNFKDFRGMQIQTSLSHKAYITKFLQESLKNHNELTGGGAILFDNGQSF